MASASAIDHDVEAGSACFCGACGRLFRHFSAEDDDPVTGNPRCSDCAAQVRLREALDSATLAGRRDRDTKPRVGTLSKLVASYHDPAAQSELNAPPASTATTHDGEAAGVGALHEIINSMRRENRELKRRLYMAGAGGEGAIEAGGEGEGSGFGGVRKRRSDVSPPDALEALNITLEALIPAPLRATVRYATLDERLAALGVVWRENHSRMTALHAALMGSEATCATLQEELLMLETSNLTLGHTVKLQSAELEEARRLQLAAEEEVHAVEHREAFAQVGFHCPSIDLPLTFH